MSLWQKPDTNDRSSAKPSGATATSTPTPAKSGSDTGRSSGGAIASIGQSIEISGELTGNEDLNFDGKIDGKINLKDHRLTVGNNGRIRAEIRAKSVTVNGEVVGNVYADDKIEISPSGSVQGDLCAPRVALADGSRFKGAIDMSGSGGGKTQGGTISGQQQVARSAKG